MWQKIKTTEEITNNSKQQLQKQTNKVKKHLLPGFRMQCIHWMLNNHLTFMSTKLNSSSFSRNLFPQDLTTYLCWWQPHGSSTLPKTLLPSLMCFFVSHPIYDWFKKKKKLHAYLQIQVNTESDCFSSQSQVQACHPVLTELLVSLFVSTQQWGWIVKAYIQPDSLC